jgi:hypothetical protein
VNRVVAVQADGLGIYGHEIDYLLLQTSEAWMHVKVWTAAKRPTVATNATPSRSLHCVDTAGKKTLTSKAVADNIIKPAEVYRAEKSSNCNVQGRRSMGESEK